MNFSLKQVAEICAVSESKVIHWIQRENLAAEVVADQYRFHRSEVRERAALQKRSFSLPVPKGRAAVVLFRPAVAAVDAQRQADRLAVPNDLPHDPLTIFAGPLRLLGHIEDGGRKAPNEKLG